LRSGSSILHLRRVRPRPVGVKGHHRHAQYTIVGEIAKQWSTLHSPSCRADLDAAVDAVAQARNLDPVYRQALAYATHSYCR